METTVTRLRADNWEAVYVNGEILSQGHNIYDGEDEGLFWLNIFRRHQSTFIMYEVHWVTEEGERYLMEKGCFPRLLRYVPKEVTGDIPLIWQLDRGD